MSKEKKIEEMIEFLNNSINVERNSYFGKGCITLPLIEADKILDILKSFLKQPFPQDHENGCEYCKGRAYTKKPLTVITRYGRKIELVFEYCPKCGRKMKGE